MPNFHADRPIASHRLLRNVATAALVLVVAVGVTAHSAAAAGGPGTVAATPASVIAGSTANTLGLAYTAPADRTKGLVMLTIPAGWSPPQTKSKSQPGALSIRSRSCGKATVGTITGTGPWSIPIAVKCAAGQGFTLQESDATAPTTSGDDSFDATFITNGSTATIQPTPVVAVVAGPLDHLELAGSASTIAPTQQSDTADYGGTSATYTAEGVDRYGNPVGDETADTNFAITPDGGCSANTCTVQADGPHTVTGTDGTVAGTAGLDGDQSALTMTCRGQNYDVDGNPNNGCEQLENGQNTTSGTADNLGSVSCFDGNGHTVHTTGMLLSDDRVHADPAVAGFDGSVGSAPEWYAISASGGTFCEDDLALTLTVSGSAAPTCYQFTAITDTGTYTAQVASGGTATITDGSGAYTDGSTIDLEVRRTCSAASPGDAIGYTVDGHL